MKINELTLYNDNSQRELSSLTRNKQELMVDDNLLKLEIKRLRDMLNVKSDDVLSLEKRKLQLETVSLWLCKFTGRVSKSDLKAQTPY